MQVPYGRKAGIAPGAPPGCGRLADQLTKQTRHMRLIRQTAIKRDLSERHIGREHQALRALHAPAHQVRMRWSAEALAERPHEM